MANNWEKNNNFEEEGAEREEREELELLESILDLDNIIIRLNRLLKQQEELFPEEIEILKKLLRIVEKYKVIFEPSTNFDDLSDLAQRGERKEIKSDLSDEENLDLEIYKEINQKINIGQQMLDVEQIMKRCAKIILKDRVSVEDEEEMAKALRILKNLKITLREKFF